MSDVMIYRSNALFLDISQEIHRDALETLKLGNIDGPFDESTFSNLIEVACNTVANEITTPMETKALNKLGKDDLSAKQLYAALTTIILEAARHDSTDQELTSLLADRLTQERAVIFVTKFNAYKARIRSALAKHTSAFPNIIDIKWRVDYEVQSGSLEQMRTNLYWITLVTQEPSGEIKNVEFSASIEQLQDLLSNIKDACSVAKNLKC